MSEKKEPFGWIQWKGTDVCIDIHCECGKLTHFDGDFMYYIKCPYCEMTYECDGHIKLTIPDEIKHKGLIQTAEKDIEDII